MTSDKSLAAIGGLFGIASEVIALSATARVAARWPGGAEQLLRVRRQRGQTGRLVSTGVAGIVCEALRPMISGGYLIYGMLLPIWFGLVRLQPYSSAPHGRPVRPIRRSTQRPVCPMNRQLASQPRPTAPSTWNATWASA